MHRKNYVHRDIKPANFLIGTGKKANTLFVIDFGLAKRYISPKSGEHIEQSQKRNLTGNEKYCSANAQMAYEQSRKDDLISIAYMLIQFANDGYLPWSDCEMTKDVIYMKLNINLD